MRLFVAACLMAVCAAPAFAAERITAADGTTYTRASDGKLYPSKHVRPDGSVSLTPLDAAPTPAPFSAAPWSFVPHAVPAPSTCPNGRCPAQAPSLLPPSVIR